MQVDQWLDYSPVMATGGGLQSAVEFADQYLSLRMWFAGYDMSIADLAIWGQLQGGSVVILGWICQVTLAIGHQQFWAVWLQSSVKRLQSWPTTVLPSCHSCVA